MTGTWSRAAPTKPGWWWWRIVEGSTPIGDPFACKLDRGASGLIAPVTGAYLSEDRGPRSVEWYSVPIEYPPTGVPGLDKARVYARQDDTGKLVERELSAADGWRPIETAPDGEWILLGWAGRRLMVTGHATPDGKWGGSTGFGSPPTHWRPLPAPPEVKP